MYQFKIDIEVQEYTDFLLTNPYYSFMQLPAWAKVKDNWKSTICGLYENDKLVAGGLLLIRPLPLGKSIIYSPRGLVVDYENIEMLKALKDGLKKYGKKIGAISIKIDPVVINRNDSKYENVLDFKQDFDSTISNLVSVGFKHLGFGDELGDYFQPRFNMAIPLFDENGVIEKKKLHNSFSKGVRSYIGNYHKNRGITFEVASKSDDLKEFVRLLSCTEKRQNIQLRNEEYFKKIVEAYEDNAQIYYAKMFIPTFISYLKKAISKGENVDKNTILLNDAIKLLEERGESINLATCLMIYPKENEQIKVAEYLYAGSDTTIFPNLSTPGGIIYQAACDSIDKGCAYFNLGGVDGKCQSSLANFKMKFNPHIFEFVGEFDLPINPILYLAFTKLLPIVKKILK